MEEKYIVQVRLECLREAIKVSKEGDEPKDILSKARKMEKYIMKNINN